MYYFSLYKSIYYIKLVWRINASLHTVFILNILITLFNSVQINKYQNLYGFSFGLQSQSPFKLPQLWSVFQMIILSLNSLVMTATYQDLHQAAQIFCRPPAVFLIGRRLLWWMAAGIVTSHTALMVVKLPRSQTGSSCRI